MKKRKIIPGIHYIIPNHKQKPYLVKKQEKILFITGHVKAGISSRFKGKIDIIDSIENWQGTGKLFEYYRRELDPEKFYVTRTNSQKIKKV